MRTKINHEKNRDQSCEKIQVPADIDGDGDDKINDNEDNGPSNVKNDTCRPPPVTMSSDDDDDDSVNKKVMVNIKDND